MRRLQGFAMICSRCAKRWRRTRSYFQTAPTLMCSHWQLTNSRFPSRYSTFEVAAFEASVDGWGSASKMSTKPGSSNTCCSRFMVTLNQDQAQCHAKCWCRRSEEHTSELQSRGHLVCRLLLEKKK